MTLRSQIKLNSDGDVDLSTGGIEIITGVDALVQRIQTRLKTFAGECFLDASLGVPYFQQVFKNKNPRVSALNAAFGDAILSVDGVDRILRLAYSLDAGTRRLTVEFSVLSEDDETITGTFGTGV